LRFFTKFFMFVILISFSFYFFVLSVDPYDKFGFNFWNLETKAVNSYRDNKFYQIDSKSTSQYELFILGSSRVQGFDPDIIEGETNLKTYNYGVNNSKPEDLLAITKHIITKQKPKIIFLQTDFYNLNKNIPIDSRLKKSPLKEYLDDNVNTTIENSKFYYYEQSYTTLESLKDSIKIIYKNKLSSVEITHKVNGLKIGYEAKKEPKFAKAYFKNEYKNYEFDKNRIEYFKSIKELCHKNGISLIVSISPMNKEHFLQIMQDKYLYNKLLEFKKEIVNIFDEVYDFNNTASFEFEYPYWVDSVHPSYELPKIMSSIVFKKLNYSHIEVPENFGILLTKKNIDKYVKNLKKKVKYYALEKNLKN
jgi:hypothetical protein